MSVDIAENYWKNDLSKSNKSISVSLIDNICVIEYKIQKK